MTIQEALQNVNIVVENARMTGPERDALRQSIRLIIQRCQRADELEKNPFIPEEQHPEIPSDPKGETE